MKSPLKILAVLVLVACSMALLHGSAHAVTASDWQAGRIIDDGIFTADDMSVTDIQNFLNSKVPFCDTNGTSPATEFGRSDLTHAQYAAIKGWAAPPYICLRNYYEVPKTAPGTAIPANNYSGSIPVGAISAAQIIYNAAHQYNISPKVLLVTIQKESVGPLTTDTWPLQSQYTYAMGAHCPDGPSGAACDANYSGFSIQVSESAALLRWYLDSMDQSWWQYKKPYATNSILWNVSSTGCGASNVYIETKATAALYTYTPYQPNQAALSNMYGTGDGCSAYGNRNFWRIYNDWFGPTSVKFRAEYAGQSAFPSIVTGHRNVNILRYKNVGSNPWYDDVSAPQYNTYPVHLATSTPVNQASPFSAGWPTNNRAAGTFAHVYESDGVTLAANQHVAYPGQIIEFSFTFTAASNQGSGLYRQYFQPVLEGSTMWNMGGVAWFDITVQPVLFKASYVTQSVYPTIQKGISSQAFFRFKNTGTLPWYDDVSGPSANTYSVHLATTNPINQASPFSPTWPTNNRAAGTFARVYESDDFTLTPNQHVAYPGQIVEFSFTFTVPLSQSSGLYRQSFQPILEGSTMWNMGGLVWLDVTVP